MGYKIMKKWIAIVCLSIILIVSMVGCSSSDPLTDNFYGATTNTIVYGTGDFDALNAPTGRGATYTVASSSAAAWIKAQADYDCDDYGTLDDLGIEAALNAAPDYAHIILLPGYFSGGTIDMPHRSNLWLSGSGTATLYRLANDINAPIIKSPEDDVYYNIKISDFNIDGNYTNQTNACDGISVTGFYEVVIENMGIRNVNGCGVYGDGLIPVPKSTNAPIIRGCVISYCQDDGIKFSSIYTYLIENNVYIGLNVGNGVTISGGGEGLITGNCIDLNSGYAIQLYSTDRSEISNNAWIGASIDGVRLDAEANDNIISNNGFINNRNSGVAVNGGSNNFIHGNKCRNYSTYTLQDYGIRIYSTSSNTTVLDNEVKNNVIAGILDESENSTVRNNIGYVTENSGDWQIDSGTASSVITHGLDYTPSLADISVTPTSDLGSATNYWVSDNTSTEFTIHLDSDPTTINVTGVWQVRRK